MTSGEGGPEVKVLCQTSDSQEEPAGENEESFHFCELIVFT